ncbi:ribosome silencing factor [Ructibacterium gallinarum]|uniref:Ribosomal silencing factor RsfS n=1 Tax=Ructibacterium gallinarum TaxID=2779355 RepID=A0A9D5M469_9FIRM|nr:ribosome silencing factor [Ructibacterium gallinarum]MBE5040295.1 ribosome silencing factor [Ructibacterium gallinarum]
MACENKTVNIIFQVLDSKKAKDIEVLDVRGLTTLADYFIIATGGSDRQVQALCDHVEEELEKQDVFPVNKEGYRSGEWVLLGYDDAIVHIFQQEPRDFYDLARIWKDAVSVDMSDIAVQ